MTDEIPRHGGERKTQLARWAAAQWGNVTRAQIRAARFSDREVDGMVLRGELHRRHRGVYAYGPPLPAPEATWAAALLAAGLGSALSHTASLAVRGLITPRGVTEVTAPTQRRGDETLKIHQGQLEQSEVEVIEGLRTTSVPRMLLELAAANWPIAKLTHEATAGRHCSLAAIRAYAAANEGHKGAPALRAALNQQHTRSGGERKLHAFLTRGGWRHTMNFPIGAINVDAFLHDLNIAIELDHPETHGTSWAQQRDHWRDAYLQARGIDTLRVDTADFTVLSAELQRRAA
jgi:very-short-patch-repair endonuclease